MFYRLFFFSVVVVSSVGYGEGWIERILVSRREVGAVEFIGRSFSTCVCCC